MTDNRFNQARATRATSDRSFALGPYTFKRKLSVPPEHIVGFKRQVIDAGDDDSTQLETLDTTIRNLTEDTAWLTATSEEVPFEQAWHTMRFEGDEFGVLDVRDLGDLCEWLIAGVVERPTGRPSDSPGGLTTPTPGMPSMASSPSEAPPLTISTPDGVSMRSTPS